MKRAVYLLALLVPFGASAQGFVDEPLCYSWEGGHKSAGSFSKCGPTWVVKAPAPAAALPPPPAPSPIMMPMQSCPPVATPHKRPIVKPKYKKPPVKC